MRLANQWLTPCVLLAAVSFAEAAVVTVPVQSDFFTTAWAFGAPYVRDAGRAQLGVSSTAPYGMSTDGGTNPWEETTYFKFDIAAAGLTAPVASAKLRVQTLLRDGSPEEGNLPFAISAHRLTADPSTINPSIASGTNSYVDFKNTKIGAAESTVNVTALGITEWDVTALVNEWVANGNANAAYGIAMTGRSDTQSQDSGRFVAFPNSGVGTGQAAQLVVTTVPEPAMLAAVALGGGALLRRRRSSNS